MGITNLSGQAGKDANEFIKQTRAAGLSPTQELGKYFGVSSAAVDPKSTTKNKKPTLGDKAKSNNYSAMAGFTNSFGKLAQLNNSFVDKLYGGINSVAGTDLPTDNRASYDKDVKAMDARRLQLRDQAGRDGFDIPELAGSVTAKAPLYVAGGMPQAGWKGVGAFAGREGAIGGLDGSLMHSESTSEQIGNTALGVAGGSVGGVAGVGASKVVGKAVGSLARRSANRSGATATAATKLVDDAIADSTIAVSDTTRKQLVAQATKNLQKGKEVDAVAAIRKSLLDREGVKGTQAQVSGTGWTSERELAKRGDNNPLNEKFVEDNSVLTSKWESLADETGARPTDNTTAMESTFQTLRQGDEAAQADISAKYNAAREMSGNDLPLNHMRFIDQASRQIEADGMGPFIPPSITKVFKQMFDTPNNARFTYDKSETLIKILNAEYKKADRAGDGNVKSVIGIIRDKLNKEVDDTIEELGSSLGNGANDGGLNGTKEAYQGARGAARDRFQELDANPALRAAIDDASPDKAFNRLVLNSDKRDLIKLVDSLKATPEGQQNLADLQGATIRHFLTKATGADNGAFSTARLNKSIKDFDPERLKVLFTPEQIARINDIQKVGDVLMQRPIGSNVNDANTASSLINAMLGIVNFVGKAPKVGNLLQGGINTATKKVGDVNASGAISKAMNGQAGVTKGSSLGLTDEQLRMLGMIPAAGQAGAAVGANLGN